jgi:hypothetical protein
MRVAYSAIKLQLLMAGLAVAAAACSTTDPSEYGSAATQPGRGLMGQRSADGPAGPPGPAAERVEAGAVLR